MNYRSSLARAKAYGATGQGTANWLWQRLTALLLIPFVLVLAWMLVRLPDVDAASARHWLAEPLHTLLLTTALLLLIGHTLMGLGTVIEDYVHNTWARFSLLLLTRFGLLVLGLASLQALWHIGPGA